MVSISYLIGVNVKVIICGSRELDENDLQLVDDAVKASGFSITTVFSGTCKGGDKLGEKWAKKNKIPISKFPADWKNLNVSNVKIKTNQYGDYNANAGFARNEQMCGVADAVIALSSNTNGTDDCVQQATKMGLKVYIHNNKSSRTDMEYPF